MASSGAAVWRSMPRQRENPSGVYRSVPLPAAVAPPEVWPEWRACRGGSVHGREGLAQPAGLPGDKGTDVQCHREPEASHEAGLG